ncbi:MAG: peptidoglycan-binding protein LysM [Bacteroidales bacterium]|jgi:nucleoid-associated protein YgaU|nr:peptidoglycan-binding protein LysM [Bacteroidales bacterium]
MGLISFLKSAGEKVFGKSEETLEKEKAEAIVKLLQKYGVSTELIQVSVDDEKVILTGTTQSASEKNKIIVIAGNVNGISEVEDKITVLEPEPVIVEVEKQFYTVKSGDYLSKISKRVYGDAMKYNIIFEANRPMLKHPDKIYPGQVLIIPPLED